jgi:hypothetical protein
MPLTPGTILGQYEIRVPLGAGGMGEVYRAHDTRLGRDVAIKVLPESLTSDPQRLQRFEQEARAAAALNHPNILAVYQMSTHEGGISYLVTELWKAKHCASGCGMVRCRCAKRLTMQSRLLAGYQLRTRRELFIAI